MLKTKIKFIEQNRSGRSVVVRDSTGQESTGQVDGYGVNNKPITDILAHHFVVSRFSDRQEYSLRIDGSNPYLPTNKKIAEGTPITLSTGLFNENGIDGPHDIFKDGVLDINMYVEFKGLDDVSISKDTNYIIFTDIQSFVNIYQGDSIIVDDIIYQIDKSKDNNGRTVLYITGLFESDATSFNYLYRANVKSLLTSVSENLHAYASDVLNETQSIESREWNFINVSASFRTASRIFFTGEVPDYNKANDLAIQSYKLLKKYEVV